MKIAKANHLAKIVKEKLVIDGQEYTYDELIKKKLRASEKTSEVVKSHSQSVPTTPGDVSLMKLGFDFKQTEKHKRKPEESPEKPEESRSKKPNKQGQTNAQRMGTRNKKGSESA